MRVATGYLIWRVSMRWRAAVERAVSPLGLTHAQYTVLASLSGLSSDGARPSQRQLADFTGLEPVFVSKLVRALEAAGFVERTAHPADTRAVALRLTKRGNEVIGRAVRIVHDLLEELTEPIGGTAGRRNQELITTLRALLGAPRPTEGDRDMTQPRALFGQDLGVAHRAASQALTAVLDREGSEFAEWITLKFVNDEGAAIPREALTARLAGVLDADPGEPLRQLGSRGLLAEGPAGIELTEDGRARFDRLFTAVRTLSTELIKDLPAEDVEITRRTLARFAKRANELTPLYSR